MGLAGSELYQVGEFPWVCTELSGTTPGPLENMESIRTEGDESNQGKFF